jgi:hypothetical protein
MPKQAKVYIGGVIALGLTLLAVCLLSQWQFPDSSRYLSYLSLAVLASVLKIKLPNMRGTISLNFLFVLIGVEELSMSQTVVLGALASVIQCVWKAKKRPTLVQVVFNVAALVTSIAVAYSVSHVFAEESQLAARLAVAACVYFLLNTALVTTVVSMVEQRPIQSVWRQCYLWTLPYYLVGAAVSAVVVMTSRTVGWKPSLLILPLMYLVYSYYRLYLVNRNEHQPVRVASV